MSEHTHALRLGTRKSALALKQTEMVCEALRRAHPHLNREGAIEIVPMETLGDTTQKANLSLADHGGKALWATEHELAMRAGRVDVAVHSTKDIPGILDEDMVMPYFLPREDARDVFISSQGNHYRDLPQGAVVGTSSPRRAAMVLAARPDLEVVTFRGNVGTRLEKIANGVVDATFLAAAGMLRGGYQENIQNILNPDDMLPAVGQGAIGLEFLKSRDDLCAILEPIHCHETGVRVSAERSWLAAMGGSCRSPLAAYAEWDENTNELFLRAFASDLKGTDVKTASLRQIAKDEEQAASLGNQLAQQMLADMPDGFI
tara:strand:- start:1364 stop:2314 length:951 start_codon:yes stop_codon:yes gene_type:complete